MCESLRKRPAAPFSVSVVIEQVMIFPLSSGAGWKTNSDVVVFPSEDVCENGGEGARVMIDASSCEISNPQDGSGISTHRLSCTTQ